MKTKKRFQLGLFKKNSLSLREELQIIEAKTVQLGAFEWFHTASSRLIKKEGENFYTYSVHNILMESHPTLIKAIEDCDSWVVIKRKYLEKL